MKEIKLTQGYVAIVDDEDYEYLNRFEWCIQKNRNTFYAIRRGNKHEISSCMRMHRVIMNPPKNMQVDHINHNGLDNRKENLRIVTHRENHCNRIHQNRNGLPGAFNIKGYYFSQIKVNGKTIFLGKFKTALEAHNKYMEIVNSL